MFLAPREKKKRKVHFGKMEVKVISAAWLLGLRKCNW